MASFSAKTESISHARMPSAGDFNQRAGDAPLRLSIESEVERLINDDVRPIVSAE